MKTYLIIQMYEQYLCIQMIIILITNTLIIKNYYYSRYFKLYF